MSPQRQQKNWWGRNWKWFVPVAGMAVILLFAAFISLLIVGVMGAMKSSDAYKTAVATARRDGRVIRELGSPMTEGWFVTGNINVNSSSTSGSSGNADLSIPVSGPKGKGTIHVVAKKAGGVWSFSTLVVQVDGKSQQIDLNHPGNATAELPDSR